LLATLSAAAIKQASPASGKDNWQEKKKQKKDFKT
jgi:hypothetical protein